MKPVAASHAATLHRALRRRLQWTTRLYGAERTLALAGRSGSAGRAP
jgi:hypothetical protein